MYLLRYTLTVRIPWRKPYFQQTARSGWNICAHVITINGYDLWLLFSYEYFKYSELWFRSGEQIRSATEHRTAIELIKTEFQIA